jgi:hypothetical protein
MQKYVFLRLIYIDFIDRIYILQLCIISKRVEGNAGQILDEAPKNKPYLAMKAEFFLPSDWQLIPTTFM